MGMYSESTASHAKLPIIGLFAELSPNRGDELDIIRQTFNKTLSQIHPQLSEEALVKFSGSDSQRSLFLFKFSRT